MKLNINVDGKTYEVDVEVSEPEPVRAMPIYPGGKVRVPAASAPVLPTASAGAEVVEDESKVCRSPVTGVVTQVVTHADQAVQVDDVLLVLEAMKMETKITAPLQAKVAKVNVAVGDGVKSGQVLVEFA